MIEMCRNIENGLDDKEENTQFNNTENMKYYTENIETIVQRFNTAIGKIPSHEIYEKTTKVVKCFSEVLINAVATNYMQKFSDAFQSFIGMIEEAKNDPDSVLNFYNYQEKLDSFHWAWPFGIETAELKKLIENASCEEDFDNLMVSFFSKNRLEQMNVHIYSMLPRKHKIIFFQACDAFRDKQYALANNALFSIIDNLLGEVLNNKGIMRRKGIFDPIISFYSDTYKMNDTLFLFHLQMLSNSINLLFEDYDFDNRIKLNTSKTVRRHLSIHGIKYSNKRSDTVMLLNTLCALLDNRKYINPFKDEIKYQKKRKSFEIKCKQYVLKNRIAKALGIFEEK